MEAVRERFDVAPGPASPAHRGKIAMYVDRAWHTLRARVGPDASDPIRSLDVSILQDQLLEPILRIGDIRTDSRIDFVGGARGTPPKTDRDPVCGMTVETAGARSVAHDGYVYYFCSDVCRKKFEASPQAYTSGAATSLHGKEHSHEHSH